MTVQCCEIIVISVCIIGLYLHYDRLVMENNQTNVKYLLMQRPGQHGLEVPNDDIIDDSGSEELTEPIQTSSIPMTPEQIQLSSSQVLSPEGLQPQNPLQSSDPLENPNLDKPSFHEEIFQGSLPDMHYNPEQENDLFQPSHPGVRDLPKADTQSEEVNYILAKF